MEGVALFTRAWIEIGYLIPDKQNLVVALFTRAWIEILVPNGAKMSPIGRPLHEGVD